jgi:predicted 3-demethylubiquinone-9 3-methyltransferase (glyoxalase superfamily)
MQKISNCLWFDGQSEDAANFYVSVFRGGKITQVMRWPEDGPGSKKGDVLMVSFEIGGQQFHALNAGPSFKPTPGVSFYINCHSQDELDTLWSKLGADGGAAMACGWITDKFGVTWQVVPDVLNGYITDPDAVKAQRAMKAMMGMIKLDFATLTRAYEGR